jgi:hypothetical protein
LAFQPTQLNPIGAGALGFFLHFDIKLIMDHAQRFNLRVAAHHPKIRSVATRNRVTQKCNIAT